MSKDEYSSDQRASVKSFTKDSNTIHMIRNPILLKSLAVFFIVEFIASTVLSSFSWALTAGPSAPEFSSFEPVDTTDMVNVASGEFVYNTPLLEVPGPSGGYPLSLSYHAGIRPDQEASWVGLGFTLNPGAINRTVNGFADDFVEARRQVKDYWAGGSSTTKTYSISLGGTGTRGISTNLTVARTQDTFKGFSTNATFGVSINPVVFALGFLRDSYKQNPTVLTNANGERIFIASEAPIGNAGDIMFEEGSHALGSGTSMDISIGSQGLQRSVSVAGHNFNQRSNSAGSISSFTKVTNIGTAPLFGLGYLTLKDYYTRYWSDQTDALFAFGSLYSAKNTATDHFDNGIEDNYSEFQSFANDIYNLYDASPAAASDVKDEADPAKQIGGSLPSYDQYYVTGQGVGGMMEPYIFENGDMKGQNHYYRDPTFGQPFVFAHTLRHNSLKPFSSAKQVDFRFKNDFSNSLTISPSTITETSGAMGTGAHTITADPSGFDNSSSKQKLEGSRHIDWYTNEQIANGAAKAEGFIDCYNQATDRAMSMEIYENYLQPEAFMPVDKRNYRGKPSGIFKTDRYEDPYVHFKENVISIRFQSIKSKTVSLAERIGGFKITNETGVTYHYALPVYNYNEYTRSKVKKPFKGAATISEVKNDEPYAYTWLLTAITGPDYVDRGGTDDSPNGILDDADFGYWVKFDYGKWTDSYQWRTPHTGFVTDPESDHETFSYGIKELYYLDAIETKSHKAIFIKSKRKDGRGVTSRLEGGSNPRLFRAHYKKASEFGNIMYWISPVSTLKLDAIYLFDKKDLNDIPFTKETGLKYDDYPIANPKLFPYEGEDYVEPIIYTNPVRYVTIKEGEDFVKVKYHNGKLVYDDDDLTQLPAETRNTFKANALKVIEFKTDYSLSPGVPNSIGFYSDFKGRDNPPCAEFPIGECTEMPANYSADFEWPYGGCRDPFLAGAPLCCYEPAPTFFYTNSIFCNNAFGDYWGWNETQFFRTGKLTLKEVTVLGHGGLKLLPPTVFSYNKNPVYHLNKYDEWGFYKSDWDPYENDWRPLYDEDGLEVQNTRKITPSSAQQTDAWSLSSVKSPLGTELSIKYEANTYSKSVYNDNHVFGIEKVERIGTNQVKVFFKEKNLDLQHYFDVNGTVALQALVVSKVSTLISTHPSSPDIYDSPGDTIEAIGADFLILSAPQLNVYLKAGRQKVLPGGLYRVTPYFIGGALITPEPTINKYAGGIRVKELSIKEFAGHRSTTEYSYTKPGTEISSGVTSYKPFNAIDVHYPTKIDFFSGIFNDQGNNNEPHEDEEDRKKLIEYRTTFQKKLNKLNEKVLLFGREAPAPGVMYEYVTVKNKSDDQYHTAYKVHQFRVFDEDMVTLEVDDYGTPEKQRRNITLRNEASDIGSPVAEYTYATVDDVLLLQKKYGYLYDDEDKSFETPIRDLKQGVVEQSFHKSITLKDYHWRGYNNSPIAEEISSIDKAVVTKKEERSNILTGIEEKNFKIGNSSSVEYHQFDPFSGAVLKTITTDQYGNRYLSEVVPAYSLTANGQTVHPGMGLKLFNPFNKGMISQNVATYAYKLGSGDQPTALVSAEVQTWSKSLPVMHQSGSGLSNDPQQQEVWRKWAAYNWKGDDIKPNLDGHYPIGNFQVFNFQNLNSNSAQWQRASEITLYDVQSHALMATDVNGNFAATRMSADHLRVVATASNARYHEFAYSGAEDNLSANGVDGWVVRKGDQAHEVFRQDEADGVTTHTGRKALQVTAANQKAFRYTFTTEAGRAYHASVWVNSNAGRLYYSINGGPPQSSQAPAENRKAGAWYLVTLDIPTINNSSTLEVWCETTGLACNFDDFRVHPYDAAMVSYVYNRWGELSHILDHNNLFTEYRYDAIGRLKETYKETFNHAIVKTAEVIYHYQNGSN